MLVQKLSSKQNDNIIQNFKKTHPSAPDSQVKNTLPVGGSSILYGDKFKTKLEPNNNPELDSGLRISLDIMCIRLGIHVPACRNFPIPRIPIRLGIHVPACGNFPNPPDSKGKRLMHKPSISIQDCYRGKIRNWIRGKGGGPNPTGFGPLSKHKHTLRKILHFTMHLFVVIPICVSQLWT